VVALWKRACPDISGKAAAMHLYSTKEAKPSFNAGRAVQHGSANIH